MQRIKQIKEIFGGFSSDEAPFSVVHIDRNKRKTCFPLIKKPTASHNCLGSFFIAEKIHDQKKHKPSPSIIRIQKDGNSQKGKKAEHLFPSAFPEILNGTETQISQE